MRWLVLLIGLVMMVLAGLWFFTPVLDQTYAQHVPQYAHPRSASAPATSQGVTRGAAPDARTAAAPRAAAPGGSAGGSGGTITNKALAENVLSMINLGAGIIGAWFTFLSYRMQVRSRQRRDGRMDA